MPSPGPPELDPPAMPKPASFISTQSTPTAAIRQLRSPSSTQRSFTAIRKSPQAGTLDATSNTSLTTTLDPALGATPPINTSPLRRHSSANLRRPIPSFAPTSKATNVDVARSPAPFIAQALPVTGVFQCADHRRWTARRTRSFRASYRQMARGGHLRRARLRNSASRPPWPTTCSSSPSAHVADGWRRHLRVRQLRLQRQELRLSKHSGIGINISQIGWVSRRNLEVSGNLLVNIAGSGSFDDPRLTATASAGELTLGGQHFGALEISAHTASHNYIYTATTQLQGANLSLKGQTAMSAGYATHAQLPSFPSSMSALSFAWRVLTRSAPIPALAGTVSIDGPLADLKQIRGDARPPAVGRVTVAGVPLQSDGPAHATLAGGIIHLDPLHITGDNTDLRAQGSLSLEGNQQLDPRRQRFHQSQARRNARSRSPPRAASPHSPSKRTGPFQNPSLAGKCRFPGLLALAVKICPTA